MTSAARKVLAFAATAALAGGCGRRMLYEWRDEPYMRPVYAAGEAAARRRMGSRFADDRDIGCRVLSVIGREAARSGDAAKAREIAGALIAHCEHETSAAVRSTILAVCLRNVGTGSERVHEYLRKEIAFGGESASAAYALAALDGSCAFESIAARYRASADHGLKYELLGALWLLGDARGVDILKAALADMEGPLTSWPERIHHMTRETCATALRSRLDALKKAAAAKTADRRERGDSDGREAP